MSMARAQVKIIVDEGDMLGAEPQVQWAIGYFINVLKERSVVAEVNHSISDAHSANLIIVLGSADGEGSKLHANNEGPELSMEAESFSIHNHKREGSILLTAIGRDVRGLVYAILELADMASHTDRPLEVLRTIGSCTEQPTNPVRSITRLFTSEPEDKPWFNDRKFWDDYLTELATQRFNRFTFSVGAGYDYLIDRVVFDSYFCFFYPYVLAVPGYDVRVEGLTDQEREQNFEMLRYIASAATLRGIDFRLGLWNHSYDYGPYNTNKVNRITGIDDTNHAEYCRDALTLLLQSCPDIKGLTFRVHFEGGVPEPTHEFWNVVLSRVGEINHVEEIDFHAKGVGDELIEIIKRTGKRLVLSAKYWAEHMGPPYHQASIRAKEFGRRTRLERHSSSASSTGHHESHVAGMETTSKRSYTRYGYADFLRDDRQYDLIHRIWPGTQRILLWGDPSMAAGIGRYAGFQGSKGVEWFDPLSFKGKKGSGSPGERELYEEKNLKLGIRDWTKFRYTYRLWGRLAYNSEAHPNEWRRYLRYKFGEAADACEQALASATRILPFVLLVHAPSVANNVYWPEMYTNIPLVGGYEKSENPYAEFGWSINADFDMEPPYNFMNTSPLDPVQVYRINEYAHDVVNGVRRGKLAPLDIAERLESMADQALYNLERAQNMVNDPDDADYRRLAIDVRIMSGIGSFFAHKFRAGLAFSLYELVGGVQLLEETLFYYKEARKAWQHIVAVSAGMYRSDITFGHRSFSRGHWSDRLAAISEDIAAVERIYLQLKTSGSPSQGKGLMDWLAFEEKRERPHIVHNPADGFMKGKPKEISLMLDRQLGAGSVIRLHYRHVNQAESYQEAVMKQQEGKNVFTAIIPGEYTDSPYALQYFFEMIAADQSAWLYPGLDETLSSQPYYVINAKQTT